MKTPRIGRYHIHRARGGTARVAFELTPPLLDGSLRPEILRENRAGHCFRSKQDALLPQIDAAATPVGIIHVRQQDLIIIRFHNDSGILIHQDRFRISKSFILEPVEVEKRPKSGNVDPTLRHIIPPSTGNLVHMRLEELKRLFCDRHPEWLQSRLDAVLDLWQTETPMLFLCVAPRVRIARNLPSLIHHDPQRALSEFQKLLDKDQLQLCIQQEPLAAVKHAFVRIPRAVRIGLVRKFSTYVLNHHLDHLTERELEAASYSDAKTALALRHFAQGRRHAIMLVNSYPASFFVERLGDGSEFPVEVRESVLEHPRIWHRSHYQSFTILFRALASTLGVVFTGEELLALTQELGPKLRADLRKSIVSRI